MWPPSKCATWQDLEHLGSYTCFSFSSTLLLWTFISPHSNVHFPCRHLHRVRLVTSSKPALASIIVSLWHAKILTWNLPEFLKLSVPPPLPSTITAMLPPLHSCDHWRSIVLIVKCQLDSPRSHFATRITPESLRVANCNCHLVPEISRHQVASDATSCQSSGSFRGLILHWLKRQTVCTRWEDSYICQMLQSFSDCDILNGAHHSKFTVHQALLRCITTCIHGQVSRRMSSTLRHDVLSIHRSRTSTINQAVCCSRYQCQCESGIASLVQFCHTSTPSRARDGWSLGCRP